MKTIKGKTIARAVATDSDTVIKVGASPVPHAELGAQVKDALAAHAWALEIVEYSDCIQLNVALSDGKLDANCFQRVTYPEGYNAENGTDLVPAAAIHLELLGLCPGKTATFDGLKKQPTAAPVSSQGSRTSHVRAFLLAGAGDGGTYLQRELLIMQGNAGYIQR